MAAVGSRAETSVDLVDVEALHQWHYWREKKLYAGASSRPGMKCARCWGRSAYGSSPEQVVTRTAEHCLRFRTAF